jgi:AP-5 complex subunit zeta-1
LFYVFISDQTCHVSSYLCDVLMNASLTQSPDPYSINPFKKDQLMVTEIDGAPSRNIFTVLNIGTML